MMPAQQLVLDILLPLAKKGLEKCHILPDDILRYLNVIEERTRSAKTGSRWMINGFRTLKKKLGRDEAMVTLTAAIHKRRLTNEPVHRWANVSEKERELILVSYDLVGNIMTTDLITAQGNDPIELVACIMDWRQIRHMPVEDANGKIVGILTRKRIENFMSSPEASTLATAEEVMIKDPFCIDPSCTTKQAMQFMTEKRISCLPVIQNDQLVGLLTDLDMERVHKKMYPSDSY
jgi:CBS domain-containing protein